MHKKSTSRAQVRIIGGAWKRTPLPVLDAVGLRPTPDRVRETVFNWLNHLYDGYWADKRCLDLFAGTGALGFEAASRGAVSVTLVDSHPAVLKQLEQNQDKLQAAQVRLQRGDAVATARALAGRAPGFHLIFLDPPYQQNFLQTTLPLCAPLLAPGGLVYAESGTPLPFGADAPDWLAGWELVRSGQAGMVCFHLLQRAAAPN